MNWVKGMEGAPKDEYILGCDMSDDGTLGEFAVIAWDEEDDSGWIDREGFEFTPTHWIRLYLPSDVELAQAV